MYKKVIDIKGRNIGSDSPCFIIAEIGSNHNQDLDIAIKLIDKSIEAGADAVKFQSFTVENWISKDFTYFPTIPNDRDPIEVLRKAELSCSMMEEIIQYCNKKGIICFSTPSHKTDIDRLVEIGVPAFKFGSVQITDIPTISYAAAFGLPIILSGGASDMSEILLTIERIKKTGNKKIALLHCTSLYPAVNYNLLNLNVITSYQTMFDFPVGYSDHTMDPIIIPVAAIVKGAKIFEKHITLNRDMNGPDHKFALEPEEFRMMVDAIRKTEKALGSYYQDLSTEEKDIAYWGRRSLVTTRNMKSGEILTNGDISIKRPGYGITPDYLNLIVGKKICKDIEADCVITWDFLISDSL